MATLSRALVELLLSFPHATSARTVEVQKVGSKLPRSLSKNVWVDLGEFGPRKRRDFSEGLAEGLMTQLAAPLIRSTALYTCKTMAVNKTLPDFFTCLRLRVEVGNYTTPVRLAAQAKLCPRRQLVNTSEVVEGGIKRQEAAGGRELEEENWKQGKEAGNWRKGTGGRELEEENWRQGTGRRRMKTGGKELEERNWRQGTGGRYLAEIEVKNVEVVAFFPESLSYSRVSSKFKNQNQGPGASVASFLY